MRNKNYILFKFIFGLFNLHAVILLWVLNFLKSLSVCVCFPLLHHLLFFLQFIQQKLSEKNIQLAQQKSAVKLTFSNGSITNVAVNISEELGKTSIWKQLTENSKSEGKLKNQS